MVGERGPAKAPATSRSTALVVAVGEDGARLMDAAKVQGVRGCNKPPWVSMTVHVALPGLHHGKQYYLGKRADYIYLLQFLAYNILPKKTHKTIKGAIVNWVLIPLAATRSLEKNITKKIEN